MMFRMTIRCDNAAFDGENLGSELARILRHEADAIQEAGMPECGCNVILDCNGNRVGLAVLTTVDFAFGLEGNTV